MSSRRVGVALQLYTLRELATSDFAGTLERVAEIGYGGVEFAGLHGMPASDVRSRCDSLGLAVAGAHIGLARFESGPDAVAAELEALGTPMLVFPSLGAPPASIERLAAATAQARSLGLRPVFHNHTREFGETVPGGGSLWDAIARVEGLELELDLGWAWVAGRDAAALLEAHRGRIPLVHVKDHVRTTDSAPDRVVGDGEVDYGSLVPKALEAGAAWLIVEQDNPGADPLDDVARSLQAVNEIVRDSERSRPLDA